MAVVALRGLSAFHSPSLKLPSMGSAEIEIDWHLPRYSWDTHVHVFDPANFPYSSSRAYSPEVATYEQLLEFNSNLSITHSPQNIVLIQASPYGTDNSLNLALLRNHSEWGHDVKRQLRSISVFDESNVTDTELREWNKLGVRGFRINNEASGNGSSIEHLKQRVIDTSERASTFKHWKCQLFISGTDWDNLYDTLNDLPHQIIADHQGGMKGLSAIPSNTTIMTQPGFSSLLSLAKSGKLFIKISGFYRSSKLTTGGYDDLEPLIQAFAAEVPDQLIWASDWPHTGSGANRTEETKYTPEPFRKVDNVAVLKNIKKWVGPEVWQKMTVETPARVYT